MWQTKLVLFLTLGSYFVVHAAPSDFTTPITPVTSHGSAQKVNKSVDDRPPPTPRQLGTSQFAQLPLMEPESNFRATPQIQQQQQQQQLKPAQLDNADSTVEKSPVFVLVGLPMTPQNLFYPNNQYLGNSPPLYPTNNSPLDASRDLVENLETNNAALSEIYRQETVTRRPLIPWGGGLTLSDRLEAIRRWIWRFIPFSDADFSPPSLQLPVPLYREFPNNFQNFVNYRSPVDKVYFMRRTKNTIPKSTAYNSAEAPKRNYNRILDYGSQLPFVQTQFYPNLFYPQVPVNRLSKELEPEVKTASLTTTLSKEKIDSKPVSTVQNSSKE